MCIIKQTDLPTSTREELNLPTYLVSLLIYSPNVTAETTRGGGEILVLNTFKLLRLGPKLDDIL